MHHPTSQRQDNDRRHVDRRADLKDGLYHSRSSLKACVEQYSLSRQPQSPESGLLLCQPEYRLAQEHIKKGRHPRPLVLRSAATTALVFPVVASARAPCFRRRPARTTDRLARVLRAVRVGLLPCVDRLLARAPLKPTHVRFAARGGVPLPRNSSASRAGDGSLCSRSEISSTRSACSSSR